MACKFCENPIVEDKAWVNGQFPKDQFTYDVCVNCIKRFDLIFCEFCSTWTNKGLYLDGKCTDCSFNIKK